MYSVPSSFKRPVPGRDETRPVSSAYKARALFRSVPDAPGKFVWVNIPRAGSFVVLKPKPTDRTEFQLVMVFEIRVKDPPNFRLWLPLSQLRLLSMLKLGVLRGCGALAAPGAGFVNWVTLLPVGKLKSVLNPPWLMNISGWLLPKKSFGDDCQPNNVSFTRFELSVER